MATVDSTESQADNFNFWTDEDLLLEYQLFRDERYFSELHQRYAPALFSYLLREVGERGLAEDTLQETWLRVFHGCESFQKGKRFLPWLYSIASNQAIDLRRRRSARISRMTSLNRSAIDASAHEGEPGALSEMLESKEP